MTSFVSAGNVRPLRKGRNVEEAKADCLYGSLATIQKLNGWCRSYIPVVLVPDAVGSKVEQRNRKSAACLYPITCPECFKATRCLAEMLWNVAIVRRHKMYMENRRGLECAKWLQMQL